MPCRPLAAPHRQPQLSLWSSRLRQGVSICYQKKQAGTGWFQPVFCGVVSLAACRLPCVGHSGLSCVRSIGLSCVRSIGLPCVRSNGFPCVGHSGLSCVRCNGFPCVRHNGLPYVRGGGLTAAHAGIALLAALAGRIGGGLPYWWGRPQACPWACLLFAGDMAVRLHAAGRRQTFSISNSAFSTIHSCGKYCMMFHTEMPRRQYSFASSSFARIDRASSNQTSCSAFIFQ